MDNVDLGPQSAAVPTTLKPLRCYDRNGSDSRKGLHAAAKRIFDAGLPRCRVHWARNLLAHTAPKQGAAVAAMIRTIFTQDTKAQAFVQWDKVADGTASREDVLTYMDYPKEYWAQIASTNPLERLNKEIKRRADVVGIFPQRRCDHPPRRGSHARTVR